MYAQRMTTNEELVLQKNMPAPAVFPFMSLTQALELGQGCDRNLFNTATYFTRISGQKSLKNTGRGPHILCIEYKPRDIAVRNRCTNSRARNRFQIKQGKLVTCMVDIAPLTIAMNKACSVQLANNYAGFAPYCRRPGRTLPHTMSSQLRCSRPSTMERRAYGL